MDEFDTDIFTFRRDPAATAIVDDVVIKEGFRDDALLDSLTDDDIADVAPYIFGFAHTIFN
jgi:hypothetical protein